MKDRKEFLVKTIKDFIFGVIILTVIAFPIVMYLANTQEVDDIIVLSYIGFNIITIILIYLYYKFIPRKNSFALPLIFMASPVIFFSELALARSFVDINSCPAGWEIWSVFLTFFYSMPFFITTFIISIILLVRSSHGRANIAEGAVRNSYNNSEGNNENTRK